MITIFQILLFSLFFSTNPTDSKEIQWIEFTEALKTAKEQNKYVLVDFYTDWCSWCKVMDKNTYANGEVITEISTNFIAVKVNAEDKTKSATYDSYQFTYPELTAAFGVRGFPATVFLNSQGEYLTQVPGYIEKDNMLLILKYFSSKSYQTMDFQQFAEKSSPK